MSYKKIADGMPVTTDLLNRFVGNSAMTWVASTSFSGSTSFNFSNIIDNSVYSAVPKFFTRIVLSNLETAAASAIFIRLINTAGTVIDTNTYYTGYYGYDISGAINAGSAGPGSVFLIGNSTTGSPSAVTLDIHHNQTNGTQVVMQGLCLPGSGANYPATLVAAGSNFYTALPIQGIQLITYFSATTCSGTLNAYQYRRTV